MANDGRKNVRKLERNYGDRPWKQPGTRVAWYALHPIILLLQWRGRVQGRRQRGDQWCPAPHLKSVPPHFAFGPPVVTYIQYCILKRGPPFWFLAPPAAKSWRRAWAGTESQNTFCCFHHRCRPSRRLVSMQVLPALFRFHSQFSAEGATRALHRGGGLRNARVAYVCLFLCNKHRKMLKSFFAQIVRCSPERKRRRCLQWIGAWGWHTFFKNDFSENREKVTQLSPLTLMSTTPVTLMSRPVYIVWHVTKGICRGRRRRFKTKQAAIAIKPVDQILSCLRQFVLPRFTLVQVLDHILYPS